MVKKNYDDMLSRFHLIPERNGQTDGRTDCMTDRFAICVSRVSMLTRDKNCESPNSSSFQSYLKSWLFAFGSPRDSLPGKQPLWDRPGVLADRAVV